MSLTVTQHDGYSVGHEDALRHPQQAARLLLPGLSRNSNLEEKNGGGPVEWPEGRQTEEAGTVDAEPRGQQQELVVGPEGDKLDPLLARFIDECLVPLCVTALIGDRDTEEDSDVVRDLRPVLV